MALRSSSASLIRAFSSSSKALPSFLGNACQRNFSAAAEEPDFVKEIVIKQQQKFRAYLSEIEKVKIPLDPEDDKAVQGYAKALQSIRKKVGVPSFSEKMGNLLNNASENSDTFRSFLEEAKNIRIKLGIEDQLGAEPLMFDALAEVEKKIGKPLIKSDKEGVKAWGEQMKKINKKLGLDKVSLEDVEKEIEIGLAKAEIESFRAQAIEIMETQKKKDGLEHIKVDINSLDPRPYI